jgi:hypothetical protein
MAWEERERGGPYYTRSKKINGRVVREYVGGGRLGKLAAEADALERRRREEEAEARRAERDRLETLEAPVAKLCEIAETLARAALLAAGYHRHNRGEWRKRRMSPSKKKPTKGTPARKDRMSEKLSKGEEDILKILRRAERGDKTVLPDLRELLDLGPELASVCGDLAKTAERELIGVMAGKDLLMKETVPRKLKAMREELSGPSPTSLEKLLVERVVACWLALQHAELLCTQGSFGRVTVHQVELYQRRLDRAQKRFLSAIRTLAQIRKLGPAVQINVAEQQVNVVGQ